MWDKSLNTQSYMTLYKSLIFHLSTHPLNIHPCIFFFSLTFPLTKHKGVWGGEGTKEVGREGEWERKKTETSASIKTSLMIILNSNSFLYTKFTIS